MVGILHARRGLGPGSDYRDTAAKCILAALAGFEVLQCRVLCLLIFLEVPQ